MHRLSISPHRERFVLKGAMLMTTWFDDPHRPTRDVDFLGYGDPAPESLLATFRDICAIDAGDGMSFDVEGLRVELIREALDYGGLRLRTTAALAGARITIVIDIGFGDAVEPGVEEVELPVLLDLPSPRLRAYARETVIAEKFHAMVMLGLANSRMKDFYDVWILSRSYDFDEDRLARAIEATFTRRGTDVPVEEPVALSQSFAKHEAKQRQWLAFVRDLSTDVPALDVVVANLSEFLLPHARRAKSRSPTSTSSRPER
ncbi:MAG: nucleotidyl transferase AbiEii/AbiGii toxin family protein [Burkholderiaceae bacterium]|nr:nucleotidyl transferase AbiEii/AbiGii toxin family protein [Burkholderiaceae bacterium]MDO9089161.1 nucleotidyl transferase AbiEii/AbiGii toxin family protein [Burkholderiaceae bacterium]